MLLLVTSAAAPPGSLPIPPIPPANPPTGQIAPLPDRDARGPTDNDRGMRVRVQDFRVQRPNPGFGYAPGSRFETSEEKRSIQTPGVMVQMPLQ